MVELKAVAISLLFPVAVAQHALDGHAVGVGAMPGAPVAEVAEVWAPGRNVGRKYAAMLKRLGQPRQSDLSKPESVGDLGAVECVNSSIKFCAASLLRAVIEI
jgi:hypothetical protein